MIAAFRRLRKQLTFRFSLFYLALILLPTAIFLILYMNNVQQKAAIKQQYEQTASLQQSLSFAMQQIEQAEGMTDTLQSSAPLLTLLDDRFPSAADELYAYVSYIQPLFDSVRTINPLVTDLFIYRYKQSFITNHGLVHSLRDIADYPYPVMPGNNAEPMSLWSTKLSAESDEEVAAGPRYIYLSTLWDPNYHQVIAIVELQIDVGQLFFPALPVHEGDRVYLTWQDITYPLTAGENGRMIVSGQPMQALPQPSPNEVTVSSSTKNLTITWHQAVAHSDTDIASSALTITMLLIPLLIFCIFVYRFAMRITRFSKHIVSDSGSLPTPYYAPPHRDEFDNVIRDYNDMTQIIREQVDAIQESERLKNAAHYYAMSSQVNPHFMFNTLESIRMQIELQRYDEASRMLQTLGQYLRYNIAIRDDTQIAAELEHVRHYLLIYQFRMNKIISYEILDDQSVPNVKCPFCILQPIVENSLQHGLKGSKIPLHIIIRLSAVVDGICVEVIDNGSGMTREAIAELNRKLKEPSFADTQDHVGLLNVNNRIRYYYGAAYGLSFTENPVGGLICQVHLGHRPSGHVQTKPHRIEEARA